MLCKFWGAPGFILNFIAIFYNRMSNSQVWLIIFCIIAIISIIWIIAHFAIKETKKANVYNNKILNEEKLNEFLKKQTFAYTLRCTFENGNIVEQRSDKNWGQNSINIVKAYFKNNNYNASQTLEFLKSDFGLCVIYEFNKIKTDIYDNKDKMKPMHFMQAIVNANNNFQNYKDEEFVLHIQCDKIITNYIPK